MFLLVLIAVAAANFWVFRRFGKRPLLAFCVCLAGSYAGFALGWWIDVQAFKVENAQGVYAQNAQHVVLLVLVQMLLVDLVKRARPE
jgi:hypothetical protein